MRFATLLPLAGILIACGAEKTCTQPGIIPGDKPNQFIACVKKRGVLQTVLNECSVGSVFDIEKKICTTPGIQLNFLRSFAAIRPARASRSTVAPSSSGTAGVRNQEYYEYYKLTNGPFTFPFTEATTWLPYSTATTTPSPPPPPPPSPPPPPPLRKCKGPGAFCSNCNTLSFCTATNVNGIREVNRILDVPCASGQVCETGTGCVNISSGGLCKEGPFECGDVGLYPDLYDCTIYHTCIGNAATGWLIDIHEHCQGGLFGNRWNPITSSCGWSEDVNACKTSPVPACTSDLQMGSAGGQIYYICIVNEERHTISPRLFRCPGNRQFDEKNFACVEPGPAA